MSTPSIPAPVDVVPAATPLAAGEPAARHARAGLAMSLATFAMAAASAIQAVLYLSKFGTNVRTDGFFVAFAVYTTFGVFSQSLRLTSVPLLVEPGARLSVRQFAAALTLIGLPVLVITGPLSGLVADVIAPGLTGPGRHATESALPVLGAAMVLQLWAAGGATVLAIRARFNLVAGAYMAGAAGGLVAFLAIMGRAGEQTLGWSMLAMAVITCTWMLVGVRLSGGMGARKASFDLGTLVAQAGLILGRTAVYLVFNMLFVVTLAFVGSKGATGDATVLSYAYLFASYLVAGTGMALGMSRIPDMTRAARAERRAVVAETVPQGFRYAMLIVAPALAGLITVGAPLIHRLFPGSLDATGVHTLRVFAMLLVPWTVAALLVSFLLPALFAIGRARLLNALAPPLLVLHVLATAVGAAAFGVDGAVGAMFVAPVCFGIALLVAGAGPGAAGMARELGGDAARFLILSGLAFGGAWLIGKAVPEGLTAVSAAAIFGSAAYLAGLALVARRQVTVLLGVFARPTPA
jgi:peptidoglycan biosynthesis protein MviN/MurJ (putative lipid II flippase)